MSAVFLVWKLKRHTAMTSDLASEWCGRALDRLQLALDLGDDVVDELRVDIVALSKDEAAGGGEVVESAVSVSLAWRIRNGGYTYVSLCTQKP